MNADKTLKIRVKSTNTSVASDTASLYITARSTVAAPDIDYVDEEISLAGGFEYRIDGGAYTSVTGDSIDISGIIPDNGSSSKTLVWRKPATISSFVSQTNSVTIPQRPATPNNSIDYINETITGLTTDMEYSIDGSGFSNSTGTILDISSTIPDYGMEAIEVVVREKAVASTSFASELNTVSVPPRSQTPSLKLTDPNSVTAEFLTSTSESVTTAMNYQYKKNAGIWTDITTGLAIDATGNNTIIVRKKASVSTFVSAESDNIDVIGYLISFDAGSNGYISSGSASQFVEENNDADPVAITANTGYSFMEWQDASGNTVSTANPITVTQVDRDSTLFAVYQLNTYNTNVLTAENGSGDVNQPTAAYNTTVTYSASASDGYHFMYWEDLGGLSVSMDNPLQVTVISDTALKPVFGIDTFNISASTIGNGTISPDDSIAEHNTSVSFIIRPDAGYKISDITVNSSSIDLTEITDFGDGTFGYTIDPITENLDILVSLSVTTHISSSPDEEEISIYPNPATDEISITNVAGSIIEFMNSSGNVIKKFQSESNIFTSHVPNISGLLFIQIDNESVYKLVIE